MPTSNQSNRTLVSTSSNFTMLTLVLLDGLGVVLLFNLNHWLIAGDFAPNLLLTWKLVLILAFSFLYYYLMDLYTFDSPLSQLGMLERSFIATLLMGITIALVVYLLGPKFIGGFVGRGVLTASLLSLWLWSLALRYLLNAWFVTQRSQIHWLVIVDNDLEQFLFDFRSEYSHEKLLLLSENEIVVPTSDSETEVVGQWKDLSRVMAQYPVSGIIITSTETVPEILVNELMRIRINGTRIFRLSDFYEKYLSRLPIFHLNQQWLATAHGFELIHSIIGLRFKRYIDVLIAISGAFFTMPIIIAIALLIFFTSGAPVFYRQVRTGENNTRFVLYKFRTMKTDSEIDGPRMAALGDSRLTTFGGILRKYRLDELPQLWNVFKGEMSFIGPRPERPEFILGFEQSIPYYNLRHLVKPGITGWAQVKHGCEENFKEYRTMAG